MPAHFLRRSAPAALLLLVAACQVARAPVPEPLQSAERMPVKGRQGWKVGQRLQWGSYATDEVKRSSTRGGDGAYGSVGGPTYTNSRRDQIYSFVQHDAGAAPVQASCRARLRQQAVESRVVDVQLGDASSLECRLVPDADTLLAWTVTLAEQREVPLAGPIARVSDSERAVYQVRGVNRLEGVRVASGTTTGYELLQGGRVVGMVDVTSGGAVILSPSLPDGARRVLAATASALLLLEDLRETVER